MATRHEIRHDRIAKRVFEQASAEQLGRRRVKRLVEDKMFQYREKVHAYKSHVRQLETNKRYEGTIWQLIQKIQKWIIGFLHLVLIIIPIPFIIKLLGWNKTMFVHLFLLTPDELALVETYEKDIQWENPELFKNYVKDSKLILSIKKMLNIMLGISGIVLFAAAVILNKQNEKKEIMQNKRLADYYAQVAETKIGQDSLHFAYRLNKEALRLNPSDAKILRQNSYLQKSMFDFSFEEYERLAVKYPFILYFNDPDDYFFSGSEKNLLGTYLNVLHVPTMKIQPLVEEYQLSEFQNLEGQLTKYLLSKSGNLVVWIEDNKLKGVSKKTGENVFEDIQTNQEYLSIDRPKRKLLNLGYSADEEYLFFLHSTGDSLLISSAPVANNTVGLMQRIYATPYNPKHNHNLTYLTSENNENHLAILTRETGVGLVFNISGNKVTLTNSVQLTLPEDGKSDLSLTTTENKRGFIFSESNKSQIIYLGDENYQQELSYQQGVKYPGYISRQSKGKNLVTLHVNIDGEFAITRFGSENARKFKTGVLERTLADGFSSYINDKGTLIGLVTKTSIIGYSIKPDTFYTYQYDFPPDAVIRYNADKYAKIILSDSLFLHLNKDSEFYAAKDGPNGLKRVRGALSTEIAGSSLQMSDGSRVGSEPLYLPSQLFYIDNREFIYEYGLADVWIKKVDSIKNTLLTVNHIAYDIEQGVPSFQAYLNRPNPMIKKISNNYDFPSNGTIKNVSLFNEYGVRNLIMRNSPSEIKVLDSAGTCMLIRSNNLFPSKNSTKLIKLLKDPGDLPAHLANNPQLNNWRQGEKERYGID